MEMPSHSKLYQRVRRGMQGMQGLEGMQGLGGFSPLLITFSPGKDYNHIP